MTPPQTSQVASAHPSPGSLRTESGLWCRSGVPLSALKDGGVLTLTASAHSAFHTDSGKGRKPELTLMSPGPRQETGQERRVCP